jgi:hypothetical protein
LNSLQKAGIDPADQRNTLIDAKKSR